MSPPGRPRSPRGHGDQLRDEILQAADELLGETASEEAVSIRAVADAVGVTPPSIYRHFPDKASLFLAAAMAQHDGVVAELSALPSKAGQGEVAANLTAALVRLAELREDIVPLELAFHADPELAAARTSAVSAAAAQGAASGPPEFLTAYLAAEQGLGRVRADIDPSLAATTLLGLLLALALDPTRDRTEPLSAEVVAATVGLVAGGLLPAGGSGTTS